jgi:DNA-binding FadR family transcriptional regulator
MRDYLAAGDIVAVAKEDFAFHWTFVELTGNQLFCDVLSRCASLLPTARNVSESLTLVEHSAIIDAVAAGRADAAAEAMYQHVVASAMRAQITLPATSLFASQSANASPIDVADARQVRS